MLPARLDDGFRRFREGRFHGNEAHYRALAELGQRPEIMVISCCDSRVPPEVIFDANPGELFVVRNVANLVPPHESAGRYHGVSAALEFAILGLKVRHVVVLGHSQCGGVRAYLDEVHSASAAGDFIGSWMSLLSQSRAQVLRTMGDRPQHEVERALETTSVCSSIQNLRTFPVIFDLEQSGELQLHGCHFDIATGNLATNLARLDHRDPATRAAARALNS